MKPSPRISITMGSPAYGRSLFSIHLRRWLTGLVACCCLQSAWANEPQAGAAIAAAHAQLLQSAQAGPVRVIVSLRDTGLQSVAQSASARSNDTERKRLVQSSIAAVLQRMNEKKAGANAASAAVSLRPSSRFHALENFPVFLMLASAEELKSLMADPDVASVSHDIELQAQLIDSGPLLGRVSGAFQGFAGSGQVVAVLDTGVDKTHPALAGRVVSEACYSIHNPNNNESSLCPGPLQLDGSGNPLLMQTSTATNSGIHCPTTIAGCDHGTHVAGIVSSSSPQFGTASNAQLIAIQVFSQCGPSCTTVYFSAVLAALDRVFALRNTYRIAAANLSLGSLQKLLGTACDSTAPGALKPIIDDLRSHNVATVIASGNFAVRRLEPPYDPVPYSDGLAYPACITSAISVGNTTNAPAADFVSTSSQSGPNLRLLAPGESIRSTVPGDLVYKSGTSMAAPHVAGAWATLKEVDPTASVSLVEKALRDTGRYVHDTRNGLLQPRIHIDRGVSALQSWSRLWPGKPVTGAAAPANLPRYFTVEVPPGANALTVTSVGGAGARGLYVRHGSRPSTSVFDCSHTITGTSHTCSFPLPTAGTYHVMLYSAANAFSGVTVSANYNNPPLTGCAPSAPTTTLPAAISGKTVLNQCGRILSAASGGTDLQQFGAAHLSSKEGVVLKTGFKVRNGARLWARVPAPVP